MVARSLGVIWEQFSFHDMVPMSVELPGEAPSLLSLLRSSGEFSIGLKPKRSHFPWPITLHYIGRSASVLEVLPLSKCINIYCPLNSKPVLLSPYSRFCFYVLGHVMQATHGAQKRLGESCAKLKTRPLSSFLLPLRGERTGLERRENWPRKIGRSEKWGKKKELGEIDENWQKE